MTTSTLSHNRSFLEWRRHRGWALFLQGWSQKDIATALGVTEGAVSQWITRAQTGGKESLNQRKAPGARPKLSSEQLAPLPALLLRGAEAFGFCGNAWTCERIAQVIQREWGITYSSRHVRVLLHHCGWSYQRPKRRAIQQKEEAIQEWHTTRLPDLKKGQTKAGINSCL